MSKVIHIDAQADVPKIKVDGCVIEEVDMFTYLGSTIRQDTVIDVLAGLVRHQQQGICNKCAKAGHLCQSYST